MESELRILLAEDHETVRAGIKMLINSQPDMTVIGEADNGDAAIRKAGEFRAIFEESKAETQSDLKTSFILLRARNGRTLRAARGIM